MESTDKGSRAEISKLNHRDRMKMRSFSVKEEPSKRL